MPPPSATTRCEPGCGASVPHVDGPGHAYITSAPGCWQLYGEVLTRDYADTDYGALHSLAVDTYAVQHPHNADRRNRQSVGVHLMSLCALLERGASAERARMLLGEAASTRRRRGWEWPHLVPQTLGDLTVADVHAAPGPSAHRELVRQWAHGAWHAFADHHESVRGWLDEDWPDTRH